MLLEAEGAEGAERQSRFVTNRTHSATHWNMCESVIGNLNRMEPSWQHKQ